MKHLSTSLILLFSIFLLVTACLKDDCRHFKSYIEYQTVLIDQKSFDAPAAWGAAQEMDNTGIVYSYGKYILVIEFQKELQIMNIEKLEKIHHVVFIVL